MKQEDPTARLESPGFSRGEDVNPPAWLPPAVRHVDGWRITPIFRLDGDKAVCVGVTVLADPDSDLRLDQATWDGLPVWDIVEQGPVSQRLALAADVYKAAAADGRPRAQAVAEAFHISPASASNLIVEVRKAGLLPATRPGVAAA